MTVVERQTISDVHETFDNWLSHFAETIRSRSPERLGTLFVEDGYWRDILALTWTYRTFAGRQEIIAGIAPGLDRMGMRNLRAAEDRTPPRLVKRSARQVIEGYFDFETDLGRATGFVRLLFSEGDIAVLPVWMMLTTLQEIKGFEEKLGARRPTGLEYSTEFAGANWLDKRIAAQAYDDHEPEVVVVGAGQSGLALAARLGQMGVDCLLVEKTPRVGDGWRNRYHSLTLHNETWANSLPYLSFPETWPAFLPKDKLAGWLEGYAVFMELNVWTGTELVGGDYDQVSRTWTVRLVTADGTTRTVRPAHLVLATGGASGVPFIPNIPGLDQFAGRVIHSSQFGSGREYSGQKAIVFGTGNSGHDVAQELHGGGAEVTMVQRSPTCVVSLVPSGTMVYALYSEHRAIDDIDLITAAVPYPVLRESYQWLTRKTRALDADLLARLNAVGFETDFEPDNTGFHMKYLRRGGGYYINVGCSDLIAAGEIRLVQARDTTRLVPEGLEMTDGRVLPADLVVLATGYENQQSAVQRLLGDEIADKVGPIWGLDENHELRNMWRPTGQDRFWIMGGNLLESRMYSRFLALQIKADLEGIAPVESA